MPLVLAQEKAEASDPIRGIINDALDCWGFPRPEEVIPVPADFLRAIGLPTLHDAVPTPKEVGDKMVSGGRVPKPPMPPMPREMADRMG